MLYSLVATCAGERTFQEVIAQRQQNQKTQDCNTRIQRKFFSSNEDSFRSFIVLEKGRECRDLLGASAVYILVPLKTLRKVGVNINISIYVVAFLKGKFSF